MDQVPIENKRNVIDLRMTEIEVREEITNYLRDVYEQKIWRKNGYRSMAEFCLKELGYSSFETKERLIEIGAILTPKTMTSSDPGTQARIDVLRAWRREKASQQAIATYRILSNRTVMEIAGLNPKTKVELRAAHGMGEKKMQDFADEILEILKSNCSESN